MSDHKKSWLPFAAMLLLLSAGFTAMIVQASLEESVAAGLQEILSTAWGRVTLADLTIGLVFVAGWMTLLVGPKKSWPWVLALFLLGNLTLLVFLLMRLRHSADLRSLVLGGDPHR